MSKEKPGFEWFYLKRLMNRRANVLRASGPVTSLALSKDGRTLASVGGDGTLRLWRAYRDKELEHDESGPGNRRWGLPPP